MLETLADDMTNKIYFGRKTNLIQLKFYERNAKLGDGKVMVPQLSPNSIGRRGDTIGGKGATWATLVVF
jgi:DNA relaxase NicK